MATSETGGEVLYAPDELGANRFACAYLARDLLNTLLHKADMASQVRACWVAPTSTAWSADSTEYGDLYGDGAQGALSTGSTAENGTRYYFFGNRAVFAPKLRADGSGYKIRVHLGGSSSDGGIVDFGVAVFPRLAAPSFLGYSDAAWALKLYTGITSTTPAWLTPDGGTYTLPVPRRVIDAALALEPTQHTLTDVGGAATAIIQPLLTVVPFGQTRSDLTKPRLHGFLAAEVLGT